MVFYSPKKRGSNNKFGNDRGKKYDRYKDMQSKRLDKRAQETLDMRYVKRKEHQSYLQSEYLKIQKNRLKSKLDHVSGELTRLGKEHRRIGSISKEYGKKVRESFFPSEKQVDRYVRSRNRVESSSQGIENLSNHKKGISSTLDSVNETIKKINPNKKK